MPRHRLNVFLSATGQDLEAYRNVIRMHTRTLDAFHIVSSEEFGARPDDAYETCRDRVHHCDVLVCVVGHRRGWEPPGDNKRRSITECEYDWAGEAGLKRLMFVSPENAIGKSQDGMTAEEIERQKNFRKRIISDRLYDIRFHKGEFKKPADLAAAVVAALANLQLGQMLAEIRAGDDKPSKTRGEQTFAVNDTVSSPEAALTAFAEDTDLDSLLSNPAGFDIAKLEAKVVARAAQNERVAR